MDRVVWGPTIRLGNVRLKARTVLARAHSLQGRRAQLRTALALTTALAVTDRPMRSACDRPSGSSPDRPSRATEIGQADPPGGGGNREKWGPRYGCASQT